MIDGLLGDVSDWKEWKNLLKSPLVYVKIAENVNQILKLAWGRS